MLSDRLTQILEKQADRLTHSWLEMLQSNANTQSYHKLDDKQLIDRVHQVYKKLSLWMDWKVSSRDLAQFFTLIGQERRQEKLPLSEVVYAIFLARRNLQDHIKEESVIENALDLQRLIEFNTRVNYFFDKVTFFVIQGYENVTEEVKKEEGMLDKVIQAFSVGTSPPAKS